MSKTSLVQPANLQATAWGGDGMEEWEPLITQHIDPISCFEPHPAFSPSEAPGGFSAGTFPGFSRLN